MLPHIIVILGPTASGKSSLAVELARRYNGEIVSADSRQVYRGLDIGTGKISKSEMRGIPHHMLDVADPKRQYTVAQYQRAADRAINRILRIGKIPLICGGTGFYVDAVLRGTRLPNVKPNARLRKKLQKKTVAELLALLKKLDPKRAKHIDPHNPVRLIRAIEIVSALGKVPSIHGEKKYETFKIGLALSKEKLYDNIHKRLHVRMRQGMVAEAGRVHRQGVSYRRMEALGLEYRYLAYYLQRKLAKTEMLAQLEKAIQHYAKRQMTWFRRDQEIHWVKNAKEAQQLAKHFLKKESSPQS